MQVKNLPLENPYLLQIQSPSPSLKSPHTKKYLPKLSPQGNSWWTWPHTIQTCVCVCVWYRERERVSRQLPDEK